MIAYRIIRLLAGWLLLAALVPAAAHAQLSGLSEYQIKAAFLYNFAKFTDWGADIGVAQDNNFVICVTGPDRFGTELAAIEGKAVHGRELRVRRNVAMENLRTCHVLFVTESEDRRTGAVLKAVEDQPVLTVSDIDGFAELGGMVTLVGVNNRVQFDINLKPARRAHLKFSSQLLKLARTVIGGKAN